jgi:hypothetical protein
MDLRIIVLEGADWIHLAYYGGGLAIVNMVMNLRVTIKGEERLE